MGDKPRSFIPKQEFDDLLREGYEPAIGGYRAKVKVADARLLRRQAEGSARVQGDGLAVRLHARIRESREENGVLISTVELLDGEDLQTLIAHHGRLDVKAVVSLARQLARILDNKKAKALFPSLCPRNVFISGAGTQWTVDLLEFETENSWDPDRLDLSRERNIVRDLQTCDPPERILTGNVSTNERSYVWSMGLVVFYALVGRSFWLGESLDGVRSEVLADSPPKASERAMMFGVTLPPRFDDWFGKCLHPVPLKRHSTPGEAANALSALMLSLPGGTLASANLPQGALVRGPGAATEFSPPPPFQDENLAGPPSLRKGSGAPSVVFTSVSPASDYTAGGEAVAPPLRVVEPPRRIVPPESPPPVPHDPTPLPRPDAAVLASAPAVLKKTSPSRPKLQPRAPDVQLVGHEYPVKVVSLSSSCTIFSGDNGGNIFAWDILDQSASLRFDGHEAAITGIRMLSDDFMVSACAGGRLIVWRVDEPESKQVVIEGGSPIHGLGVSSDGTAVAAAREDGTVCMLDVSDRRSVRVTRELKSGGGPLHCVAVDRSGRRAFAAGADGRLSTWDLRSSTMRKFNLHEGPVYALALAGENRVLSGGTERSLKVTNVLTGHTERTVGVGAEGGHREEVRAVVPGQSGNSALSCDTAGRILLWSFEASEPIAELKGGERPVWDVAVSHQHDRAVAACADRSIFVWERIGLDVPPGSS